MARFLAFLDRLIDEKRQDVERPRVPDPPDRAADVALIIAVALLMAMGVAVLLLG